MRAPAARALDARIDALMRCAQQSVCLGCACCCHCVTALVLSAYEVHCVGAAGTRSAALPAQHIAEVACRSAKGPNGEGGFWEPCAPSARGAEEKDLMWFGTNDKADKVLVPPIVIADFYASLERARPTVSKDDLTRYEKFTAEFGEEGV